MALPGRLLLIDDEEPNCDFLSRRLTRRGYQVDTAENGEQAIAMLHSGAYDLVLLDQMMPLRTGIDLLERIRQTWSAWELPVIMVTAINDSASVVKALELGANDYVTKPVDFAVTLARIEARLRLAASDREVRRNRELYQLASQAAGDGLWEWDLASGVLWYSARWKAMLGYAEPEIGQGQEEWFGRIHPDDQEAARRAVELQKNGSGNILEMELRMLHKDGHYRWMENRGSVERNAAGQAVRIAGYQADITVRKTVDALTGLPNRQWLEGELSAAPKPRVLALLDLDGFDRIEQSLARGPANSLVAAVAGRLARALDGAGSLARIGEHQFGVLLGGPRAGAPEARRAVEILQGAMTEPFRVETAAALPLEVPMSLSAGIAVEGDGGQEADLLRDAQAALRRAREQGTNHCEVFHAAMRRDDLAEMRLEHELRRALERREFEVFYQPKVDLATGKIAGTEALVRWHRPGQGIVGPNLFIPIAERTGLVVPLGRFVLEQACRDTAELRRAYRWLKVSVNVSGRQLAEPDLVEQVRACLESSQLDPSALHLEITETFLVQDPEKALAELNRLREMGIGLKLDDFGSGYASLDYLQKFPFDTLKIDRSFVMGLPGSHESSEIVRAIVGLAHSLKLTIVAEGIETAVQLERLKSLGCHYGQGYWFSPPLPLDRFKELLDRPCGAPDETDIQEPVGSREDQTR